MFHALRTIASFALLGAVLTGAVLGWFHTTPFDPRLVGAAVGAFIGLLLVIGRQRHVVTGPDYARL